jgi:hypothetical protein
MWTVAFHPELTGEIDALPRNAAKKLAECLLALAQLGPQLGRPLVDTLKGSRFANMKELRFTADGVWRFAFAFDPKRKAILLAAMDKSGVNQARAYAELIAKADRRFADHLVRLETERKKR